MSWWHTEEPESGWQTIVSGPTPLEGLMVGGYGKDLELEVNLAGGPSLRMGTTDVAVHTDGAVEMQLVPYDDVSLVIRYTGPGLEIRSMQVDRPDPEWEEEFTAATRAFLANGGELGYCVGARIALAALPDSPADGGDQQ